MLRKGEFRQKLPSAMCVSVWRKAGCVVVVRPINFDKCDCWFKTSGRKILQAAGQRAEMIRTNLTLLSQWTASQKLQPACMKQAAWSSEPVWVSLSAVLNHQPAPVDMIHEAGKLNSIPQNRWACDSWCPDVCPSSEAITQKLQVCKTSWNAIN